MLNDPDVLDGLDPLLKPEQVATLLGMSVKAVRKAIWRGTIPSCKLGRQNRVRKSDLAAFIASRPQRVVSPQTNGDDGRVEAGHKI